MTELNAWRERQYWSDVVAARPDALIEQWIEESRAVRCAAAGVRDHPYGRHPRQRLDVFRPNGSGPWPLLVFVHGGYWQLGDRRDWAFLARGWNRAGVAVATLGYRVAPEVTLEEIADDVRAALAELATLSSAESLAADRIVVAGVSAGAHLSALAVAGPTGGLEPHAALLISGVYDPHPLGGTTPGVAIEASLELPVERISPYGRPAPQCPALICWGGAETDVFRAQSQSLCAHWQAWGANVTAASIDGVNHYTIVECLQEDHDGPIRAFLQEQFFGTPGEGPGSAPGAASA
ncbi:MAG: alpha/beta hydrolase [Pseudomonadota bacterium]